MSKRKLLLADDSITIQKVVNLTFADEGIEVITAGDGNAAIERFSEFAPDLVLADVNMPGLNGYEVCEIIRKNEETKNVPVILLVGSFEPFDETEAKRVGANDFLTKPFQSIRQLVNKVNDLIGTNGDEDFPQELESLGVQTQSTEPELDDIDNLYKESFADTAEMPGQSQISDKFTDPGMDDEMIETSFTGSSAEEEPFPPLDEPVYQQKEEPPEHSFSQYDESAFRAPEKSLAEEESTPPEEKPLTDEAADFEKSFEEIKAEQPQETSPGEQEDQFAPRFDEENSLSQFEEEKEEETLFEAVSDTEQESKTEMPTFGQAPMPWSSIAETIPPRDEDVQQNLETSAPPESQEPTTARFEFDELNLLELPGGRSAVTDAPASVTESFPHTESQHETAEMSQETIDQIAAKVADRVAEQVIREIAGRIPDIVDAAVAKKMREAANG